MTAAPMGRHFERRRRIIPCLLLVGFALQLLELDIAPSFEAPTFATTARGPRNLNLITTTRKTRWLPSKSARNAGGGGASLHDATIVSVDIGSLSEVPDQAGVYVVNNINGIVEYIGLSRQIRVSVARHMKAMGKDALKLVSSIRYSIMPKAGKEELKVAWTRWMDEHLEIGGQVPSGNMPDDVDGADPRWRNRAPIPPRRMPLELTGKGVKIDALKAVETAVSNNPVLLFMKGTPDAPQCGFSAKAVSILRQADVDFDTVDVLNEMINPGVRKAIKTFTNWPTIPQIFIGGRFIGGVDVMSELSSTRQLQDMMHGITDGKSSVQGETREGARRVKDVTHGRVSLIDDPARPTASEISRLLYENFDLHGLQIHDESEMHTNDAGAIEMGLASESHFTVDVVASEFEGLDTVQRQQEVFNALANIMPRVHALSMSTRTPNEMAA